LRAESRRRNKQGKEGDRARVRLVRYDGVHMFMLA
jgi:hypothetical protein